ncbi:MAG: DUF167 domain-containing protein [Vulcanimicrobiota bacterium]
MLSESKNGKLRLAVKVRPASSPQGVAGVHNGHLIIKVSAPAVDGKANSALVAFLAKKLGIKKTKVLLVNGEKSRTKVLELSDVSLEEAREKLGIQDDE